MTETSRIPKRYLVDLHIPPDEWVRYYRGDASDVITRTRSGIRIRFPAAGLRAHVTRDGIHGTFVLEVDGSNRLVGVRPCVGLRTRTMRKGQRPDVH